MKLLAFGEESGHLSSLSVYTLYSRYSLVFIMLFIPTTAVRTGFLVLFSYTSYNTSSTFGCLDVLYMKSVTTNISLRVRVTHMCLRLACVPCRCRVPTPVTWAITN